MEVFDDPPYRIERLKMHMASDAAVGGQEITRSHAELPQVVRGPEDPWCYLAVALTQPLGRTAENLLSWDRPMAADVAPACRQPRRRPTRSSYT